jgi:hypothetical protein
MAAAADERRELLLEQRLDPRTDVPPQPVLDRVMAGITAQQRRHRRICDLRRGVISLAVAAAGQVA